MLLNQAESKVGEQSLTLKMKAYNLNKIVGENINRVIPSYKIDLDNNE